MERVQMRGISKAFGRTQALLDVSLEIRRGEIVGFVGENGSGKSTLAAVLCGSLRPDAGDIRIDDRSTSFRHPRDALRHGIVLFPQFAEMCPDLSVAENITIGQEPARMTGWAKLLDRRSMASRAREALSTFDAHNVELSANAGQLSGGQQKSVMLARVLLREPSLIVFDEPSASLGVKQKARMRKIIAQQKANGRAIVLISHDVEEVSSLCDRVIVLHAGCVMASMDRSEIRREQLVEHMASGRL
jgi:ABC-type sugar transport system ATPase subunit